jgi:protein SCO1/2
MKRNETSKFQPPSSRELPSIKLQCSCDAWLKLGGWSFSGAWMLVLGALLVVSATGCRSIHATSSCCAPVEAAAAFSDKSLYQTESKWTTDAGKQIKLADLKGRPQVVVMFFASCQYACPILVHDLQKIEAALKPESRTQVGFTLVTIDPRRDTPEALASFRATRVLPAATWTLLHGESDDILELAALLGVKYKEEANGQFAHSNIITVLNAEGEIVHQLVGLGQDVTATVRELEKLLSNTNATAQ